MDRPTDLTGRTGGDPDEGPEDVARAFRAALDGTDTPSTPGSRTTATAGGAAGQRPPRPSALLSAVERRAAQLQRRRRATVLGGAAAAAAVAVFVGSLVLPGLDLSLGGAQSSSAGGGAGSSAESGDSGGSGGAAAPAASASGPTALQDRATGTTANSAAADVPTLSEASMLTAADLSGAFSVPVQESAPAPESTPGLTLGACVDGDAGSVEAPQLWRVDLVAAPSASAAEPPGVVERVAVVPEPAAATYALDRVRQAAAGCTGPGPEGTEPTTELDASAVTPDGGQALVLASTSGQGSPTLQVLVAVGSEVVQLQVTSDAPSAQAAYDALVPAVRTAVQRATGGAASFSAPLPSAGAP
ncbi:hypothetical protein FHN55_04960 [Streptomyces sp. NP160]|uniref:hypothetical protein n=1 Tax=Streptomyces sp. NP160 TaxID=2586637 RepID=UPI00111ABB60|nr:hypothetical protein [Streptomyces sp. NP160]TNM69138.1 hypothetical protein FHN55_04960 [Streptomyces sp. NP160]